MDGATPVPATEPPAKAIPLPASPLEEALPLSLRARWILALLNTDPVGLGGVVLKGGPGPRRDAWLARLKASMGPDAPWLRLPHHATESALLGGLDLPATLHIGRPVVSQGLLARADGGVLVLSMAERAAPMTVALLCGAMDRQQVDVQRDGLQVTWPCRWSLVALDEGLDDAERLPEALRDRLAFAIDPDAIEVPATGGLPDLPKPWHHSLTPARLRPPAAPVSAELLQALAATAAAWGVTSMRALLLAVRAARSAASLDGTEEVQTRHAELAAALVLAPRATQMPAASESAPSGDGKDPPPPGTNGPPDGPPPPPSDPRLDDEAGEADTRSRGGEPQELQERLTQAVRVGLPAGLLAQLQAGTPGLARARGSGRFGASQDAGTRGRVVGSRPGHAGGGARLHLIDTLRAAAPWQRIRRTAPCGQTAEPTPHRPRPVLVRPDDLRSTRRRQHRPGTTVFLVDASGSSALHRMAEAKGAVELLLAECYVRRDQVAVLAFRGTGAQVLLPPTRSLVRAKRQLAALPGGGGTPLASGIEAARELCLQIGRRGELPMLVLLTDGRANIAADGGPGRERATADAHAAAVRLREQGLPALLIDTSPQPGEAARLLAERMGARYLALPHAGASSLAHAVQQALPQRPE